MNVLNVDGFLKIIDVNHLVEHRNENKLISSGSYGEVYDIIINNNNYVIKLFKKTDVVDNIKNIAKKYFYLFKKDIGPELIQVNLYTDSNYVDKDCFLYYGIVMEKYEMDLKMYFSNVKLDRKKLLIIEHSILVLINKIYRLNVIYTDLKFSNILINTNDLKVRLTDFDNQFCYDNSGKNKILNNSNKRVLLYLLKMGMCVESMYCYDVNLNIIYKKIIDDNINSNKLLKLLFINKKKYKFKPFFYNMIKKRNDVESYEYICHFVNMMTKEINACDLIVNPLNNLYSPILKYKKGVVLHCLLNLGNIPDNVYSLLYNTMYKLDKILSLFFIFMEMI